jgi:hypothetical protein
VDRLVPHTLEDLLGLVCDDSDFWEPNKDRTVKGGRRDAFFPFWISDFFFPSLRNMSVLTALWDPSTTIVWTHFCGAILLLHACEYYYSVDALLWGDLALARV